MLFGTIGSKITDPAFSLTPNGELEKEITAITNGTNTQYNWKKKCLASL